MQAQTKRIKKGMSGDQDLPKRVGLKKNRVRVKNEGSLNLRRAYFMGGTRSVEKRGPRGHLKKFRPKSLLGSQCKKKGEVRSRTDDGVL